MKAYMLLCLLSFRQRQLNIVAGDDVAGHEARPLVASYQPDTCWNFTIGDWQHNEFYSPRYPRNYPNKTECIQLLVAPKGQKIRLDFRDAFNIEYSDDCKYDFLELRDGPFGYSPLLGRYCGKQHPPMVHSLSRYLWIRFKSDDSIEYDGFRVVYEFYQPVGQENGWVDGYPSVCQIAVQLREDEGMMASNDIPHSFLGHANDTGNPVDCTWVVYAPPNQRVFVKWLHYEMTTAQLCDDSFLEFYERTTSRSSRRKLYCGSLAKDIRSSSNHVYLHLFAASTALIPRFAVLVTVFTKGPCQDSMFNCGDNMCINNSLVCNGRHNCNHSWDEQSCKRNPEPTTTAGTTGSVHYHLVILCAIGSIIFVILSISVYVSCREKQRDEKCHHQPVEHIVHHASEIELNSLVRPPPSPQPTRHTAADSHVLPVPSTHPNGSSLAPPSTDTVAKNQIVNPNIAVSDTLKWREYSKPEDGATSSRYLNVNPHDPHDDSFRLGVSASSKVPALVTIESEPPGSRRQCMASRDHSPSPRPDLVSEEKFSYNSHPSVLLRKPNPENQPGPMGNYNRREQQRCAENVTRPGRSDPGSPDPRPPQIFYTRPNTTGRIPKQSII